MAGNPWSTIPVEDCEAHMALSGRAGCVVHWPKNLRLKIIPGVYCILIQ